MAPKPRNRSRTGCLQHSLMLVGELDEDVFEAGSEGANFRDGDAILQELLAEVVEVVVVVDQRMDGLPENGGGADARNLARETKRACDFRRSDFNAQGALRLNIG